MKNKEVVYKLIELGYKISFAESCTGGMCVSKIVDIADASKVLDESYVTYANSAKVKLVGVNSDTILKYGVVSEEVTKEMALGVAHVSNSNVGVSISGVAGPTGGSEKKPVGMVCFGFSINGNIKTFTKYFGNIGRNEVREKSVEFVFDYLYKSL